MKIAYVEFASFKDKKTIQKALAAWNKVTILDVTIKTSKYAEYKKDDQVQIIDSSFFSTLEVPLRLNVYLRVNNSVLRFFSKLIN